MPTLYVMAGCNGAGKSYYSTHLIPKNIEYINPDKMVKEFSKTHPNGTEVQAWRHTVSYLNDRLNENKSLAFETTLAGKTALKKMADAREKGYRVEFHYIALESIDAHHKRVSFRVQNGGHDIPSHDIDRHFRSSYENLPKALLLADTAAIYDNSSTLHPARPVMHIEHGQITRLSGSIPEPVRESLKDTRLKPGERIQVHKKERAFVEPRFEPIEGLKELTQYQGNPPGPEPFSGRPEKAPSKQTPLVLDQGKDIERSR